MANANSFLKTYKNSIVIITNLGITAKVLSERVFFSSCRFLGLVP
jgi:hypothetical protein